MFITALWLMINTLIIVFVYWYSKLVYKFVDSCIVNLISNSIKSTNEQRTSLLSHTAITNQIVGVGSSLSGCQMWESDHSHNKFIEKTV